MLICLVDSYCRAEPFLVYSPTVKVMGYQLEIDGEVMDIPPVQQIPDGKSDQLIYDLVLLEVGAHVVRARAQFENWGWVEWSEPFTIIRPAPLDNPQIVTNPPLP